MKILAYISILISASILINDKQWNVLGVYAVFAIAITWYGNYLENELINHN